MLFFINSNHPESYGIRTATLVLILEGWVNHQERQVIEYLQAENRVLREKVGKKRILLNDDQRLRRAVQKDTGLRF